jgi:hypothetical protein
MKKLIYILTIATAAILTSCSNNQTWPAGAPEYENTYYIGFQDWGKYDNAIVFTVKKDSTLKIPVQFFSEQVKGYDVTIKYYACDSTYLTSKKVGIVSTSFAKVGTDFNFVDDNGAVLTPDAKGAFPMIWPKAVKGVKNITIKAIKNATRTGTYSFYLQFIDRYTNGDISVTNRLNNQTDQYTVNAFTQNFVRKITIQ